MNADATPAHPRQIGPYQIRRVLGKGGMGTVYEALQESPQRLVALKVMQQAMASAQALRRFEYESDILARLKHPGIAQIYHAATFDSDGETLPYFAMEYVEHARTITDYARERGLDVRARLRLFLQACEAVHHGHLSGVIHRDLKPDNLLVDATGKVKVIDFGVARVTDAGIAAQTTLTQAGQVLGTFQYMSPEQIDHPLDVDTRSDVYSLGMVLYELLSRERPYDLDQVDLVEALRLIREAPPRRISTVTELVTGELELITMMALEKDRSRRYPSAIALHDDIASYLNGGPILARPPSALYQLRVFARRNKILVASAAMVFLALLVGFLVSTRQYLRAEDQRRLAEAASSTARIEEARAQAAAAEAQRQKAEAERQREEAIRQGRIARAVNQFFSADVLGAADPLRSPDPTTTVRSVLRDSARLIDRRFAGQPTVAAALHLTVASAYVGLGELEEADNHLRRSEEIQLEHAPDDTAALRQLRQARAALTVRQGHYERGLAGLKASLQEYRAVNGPGHPENLEVAVSTLYVLSELGRHEEGGELLQEVLPHARQLGDEHLRLRLLILLYEALHEADIGNYDQSITLHEKLIEEIRHRWGSNSYLLFATINNLGHTFIRALRQDEGEALLVQNHADMARILGEDHIETLTVGTNLALIYKSQGRLDEALPLMVRDYEVSCRHYGRNHPSTLVSTSNLGRLYHVMGRLDEAERLLAHAGEQLLATAPGFDLTGITLHEWGLTQQQLGWTEEALDNLITAHDLLSDLLPPDHFELRELRQSIAECYAELGNGDEANSWRAR